MAVVTLKLTATEHQILTGLVEMAGFASRSDVLRWGLLLVAKENKLKADVWNQLTLERAEHKPRRSRVVRCRNIKPRLPHDAQTHQK